MYFLKFSAISLATVILLLLTTFSPSQSQPATPQENSSINASKDPYDFTGDGRSGRRTSGGSRGDCSQLDSESELTALIPTSNWGKTVAESPSWWFYVPYSTEQTPIGVFVLQDEDYNDIYRARFSLPASSPGLMRVSLPEEESPLAAGESYRWQINLYCNPEATSAPIYVSGWIERVIPNEKLTRELDQNTTSEYEVYAREGIWFDAMNDLARQRLDNPSDPTLIEDWQQLLEIEGVELGQLKEASILGKVKLEENSRVKTDFRDER
ncbi:MAG: DUF928 domain-containing protein [Halothece sp.]